MHSYILLQLLVVKAVCPDFELDLMLPLKKKIAIIED